jgi:hypothetical protein
MSILPTEGLELKPSEMWGKISGHWGTAPYFSGHIKKKKPRSGHCDCKHALVLASSGRGLEFVTWPHGRCEVYHVA